MRALLIRWLVALLRWVGADVLPAVTNAPDAPAVTIALPKKGEDPVILATIALVDWASAMAPGTSGEYKRAQVYAKLLRAFPRNRKRDLSYAIEKVLQGRR